MGHREAIEGQLRSVGQICACAKICVVIHTKFEGNLIIANFLLVNFYLITW